MKVVDIEVYIVGYRKTDNDADMAQAVKDAQDTRAKSDQIVNQYVGK